MVATLNCQGGSVILVRGDRVRVELARRGWTVADLARALGVSRQAAHRWARDGGRRLRTVCRLTRALGCTADDLQRPPTQAEWAMLGRARS